MTSVVGLMNNTISHIASSVLEAASNSSDAGSSCSSSSSSCSSSSSSVYRHHTMAADEFSFDFVPSYFTLIPHTYLAWKQHIRDLMDSDYSFPSSFVSDIKKYCRFDVADVLFILVLTVAWTVLRWLSTETLFKPIGHYFQLLPSDRKKSPESFWKLLFYSGSVAYSGYLIFFTEDYNFFHRPGFVWEGWTPGMSIQPEVYFYYMSQGSFYVHSIFATVFMDIWRRDSIAMLVHHFITCFLIFLSYALRYCNIGLLVFFLHDVTDVELEFTKLNVYLKRRGGKCYMTHEYLSIGGFVSFAATWLVARLYWFPTRAIYSSGVLAIAKLRLPFSALLTVMLWVIYALNVYWFLYIVVFLVKVVTGQVKELVDTREYDPPVKATTTSVTNGKSQSVQNGVHCSSPIASNIKPSTEVTQKHGLNSIQHSVHARQLFQTIKCFIKLRRKRRRIQELKERQSETDQNDRRDSNLNG